MLFVTLRNFIYFFTLLCKYPQMNQHFFQPPVKIFIQYKKNNQFTKTVHCVAFDFFIFN